MDINFNIATLENMSLKDFKKNYTLLGEGLARKVFALNDNLVVKVAKGEEGYYQNFVENYVYTNCSTTERKYLCPIKYYSKKLIIMPRAMPYINLPRRKIVDFSILRDELTAEDDILHLGNTFMLFIEDLYSPTSWGFLNDDYYLIDYGCTSYEGDYFYNMLVDFSPL